MLTHQTHETAISAVQETPVAVALERGWVESAGFAEEKAAEGAATSAQQRYDDDFCHQLGVSGLGNVQHGGGVEGQKVGEQKHCAQCTHLQNYAFQMSNVLSQCFNYDIIHFVLNLRH